jgi:hypothetical protein
MFGKKSINLDMVVPTSKIALKTSCLRACDNDLEKAEKLYEFFAKDLANLPDFDVAPPSAFEQAKQMIGNAFSWIDSNQDKIVGYYQLFQQMRGGELPIAPQPMPNVPPIPTE